MKTNQKHHENPKKNGDFDVKTCPDRPIKRPFPSWVWCMNFDENQSKTAQNPKKIMIQKSNIAEIQFFIT